MESSNRLNYPRLTLDLLSSRDSVIHIKQVVKLSQAEKAVIDELSRSQFVSFVEWMDNTLLDFFKVNPIADLHIKGKFDLSRLGKSADGIIILEAVAGKARHLFTIFLYVDNSKIKYLEFYGFRFEEKNTFSVF